MLFPWKVLYLRATMKRPRRVLPVPSLLPPGGGWDVLSKQPLLLVPVQTGWTHPIGLGTLWIKLHIFTGPPVQLVEVYSVTLTATCQSVCSALLLQPTAAYFIRSLICYQFENKLFVKAEKGILCVFCKALLALSSSRVTDEAAADDPTPTSGKLLQCCRGFTNLYRPFVKAFSLAAAPLFRLTSSVSPSVWSLEGEASFSCLKHFFTSAPILSHRIPQDKLLWMLQMSSFRSLLLPSAAARTQQRGIRLWRSWAAVYCRDLHTFR